MSTRKLWYEIQLVQEGYCETIARIKSKGLAYIVLARLVEVYKETEYTVILK